MSDDVKAFPYDPPDRISTHYENCYRQRHHHNCAVARVDELERQLADKDAEIARLLEQLRIERDKTEFWTRPSSGAKP
jgi:hypothetical protein